MGWRDMLPGAKTRELARQNEMLQAQLAETQRSADLAVKRLSGSKTVPSGVEILSGKFDYEANTNLKGADKWDTLDKMMTDPHVVAVYNSIVLPLIQAEWTVQPGGETSRDEEIAEFVAANLYQDFTKNYGREYRVAEPWRAKRLPEILQCIPYGFSLFHKSKRTVGDKVVFDSIKFLEHRSVDPYGWQLSDEDHLERVYRTYTTPGGHIMRTDNRTEYRHLEPIDAEYLALYPYEMIGARYESSPKIRALYAAWYRKDLVNRWNMIRIQKLAGAYPMGFYPKSFSENDKERLSEFLRSVRGMEHLRTYLMAPQDENGNSPDVRFMGVEGGEADLLRSAVQAENGEISHGGGTRSQMVGEQAYGSRSAADTHQSLEMLMVQAVGEMICEWETHGVGNLKGVIEELVDDNFANVQNYPKLTVSKVDPSENVARAKVTAELMKMGALPNHPDLQRQVAGWVGVTLNDEIFEEAAEEREQMREAIAGQTPDDSTNRSADGEGEEDEANSEDDRLTALSVDDVKRRIADLLEPIREGAPKGGGFRFMNRLESQYVALEAVQGSMDSADKAVLTSLRKARREVEAELMKRLRKGAITRRSLESQRRSRRTSVKKLRPIAKDVQDTLRRVGGEGVAHVGDELSRQQSTSLETFAVIDEARIAGRKVTKTLIGRFDTVAETTVQMMFDDLWERMLGAFLREWTRLDNQNLDDVAMERELEAFLQDLSEKPYQDMARESSAIAYNFGRDAGLRTAAMAGLANYAVRSEILDGNTCEKCRVLDGYVAEIGTPQYDEFLPPAKCLGRGRCRGFYVALSRELTEAA